MERVAMQVIGISKEEVDMMKNGFRTDLNSEFFYYRQQLKFIKKEGNE